MSKFQPSSDLQAGCNLKAEVPRPVLIDVSTLIRPSGRMQLVWVIPVTAGHRLFQPSSDLQAGCNHNCHVASWAFNMFQPSSDLQAGCNEVGPVIVARSVEFQPSSDLQAGCNGRRWYIQLDPDCCFNPHPTFRPDATFYSDLAPASAVFQPSSDLQAGCNNRYLCLMRRPY